MRVVATDAGDRFDRIFAVCFPKRRFPWFMAVEAKGRKGLGKEACLIRTVGQVTCPAAIFLCSLVYYFLFIGIFLVALITEVGAFGDQEVPFFRGVRIMAGYALPLLQSRVNIGPVQTHFFFGMAREANLIPHIFQQKFRNDPVPQMTILAIPGFEDGMYHLHR